MIKTNRRLKVGPLAPKADRQSRLKWKLGRIRKNLQQGQVVPSLKIIK